MVSCERKKGEKNIGNEERDNRDELYLLELELNQSKFILLGLKSSGVNLHIYPKNTSQNIIFESINAIIYADVDIRVKISYFVIKSQRELLYLSNLFTSNIQLQFNSKFVIDTFDCHV